MFFTKDLDIIPPHHRSQIAFDYAEVNQFNKTAMIDNNKQQHLWNLGGVIGRTLSQKSSLAETLKSCTTLLVKHLGVRQVKIWTSKPPTQKLELEASSPDVIAFGAGVDETLMLNFIVENGQILREEMPLGQDNYGYFTGYPLMVEDCLVGVLAVYDYQALSPEAELILDGISYSIALAVDRAWVKNPTGKYQEGVVLRLANQVRNSLDLNTILETAVVEIRNLLEIDRCNFLWCLPHADGPKLVISHEAKNSDVPSLLAAPVLTEANLWSGKIKNLEVVRVDDLENEEIFEPQTHALFVSLGMNAQLLYPLETRAGQLGAIFCTHASGARVWQDEEVEILAAMVNQLALAIDQAELYAQTHAAALAAQMQAQQLTQALQSLKQAQSQLVQSEKMSSLGQMVAGVAHEINNPVNFIYGNMSYIKNYSNDLLELIDLYQQYYPQPVKEIRECIEELDIEFIREDLPRILDSLEMGAERIRQIVLSLRNFSRLDEAEKKKVQIHEGIDNTLLILHNRLKAKGNFSGIEIIKEYGNIPLIECYAGQMNQVFMNILSNAIDALENASEPRRITITTKLSAVSDYERIKKRQLVIQIKDNGLGMLEEVRKRIFDPFFTTKPVGKGTGLGLSISYQIIVDRHQGVLECFSELGKGTEFWISIPV